MCVYMCIYIYVYIYIYIYIVCVCVYVYIYTHTERDRESGGVFAILGAQHREDMYELVDTYDVYI